MVEAQPDTKGMTTLLSKDLDWEANKQTNKTHKW